VFPSARTALLVLLARRLPPGLLRGLARRAPPAERLVASPDPATG
jgi:hypothetical protein